MLPVFVSIAVMVLSHLILPGEANNVTTCFSCASNVNPKCADANKGDTELIVQCSPSATMCRKIQQTVNGNDRTIRQCSSLEDVSGNLGCITRIGTSGVSVMYCHCQGYLCNSSPSLPVALMSRSVGSALLLIMGLSLLQIWV